MAVLPLAGLPANSNVFIDANILVYGLTGLSPQCGQLLARCSQEEVFGICSFSVLSEATHQFMIAEARAKNIIPAAGNPARALKANPQVVAALRDYWQNILRVLNLNLLLLTISDGIFRAAQNERQNAGLLTNDSLIVSSLREYGIGALASHDRDFERVAGLQVFVPDDI